MSEYRDLYLETLDRITDLKIENCALRSQRFTLFSHMRVAAELLKSQFPIISDRFTELLAELESQLEKHTAKPARAVSPNQTPDHGSSGPAPSAEVQATGGVSALTNPYGNVGGNELPSIASQAG